MKKILIFIVFLVSVSQLVSQTQFSNSFGNLSLQTYTTTSSSVQYTNAPVIYSVINDGLKNNIGSAINPNTAGDAWRSACHGRPNNSAKAALA